MSLDRSLKSAGGLVQHRSVLTRGERIAKMKAEGNFEEKDSALGLPKTISPKIAVRKKVKVKKVEGAEEEAAAAAKPAAS